MRALGAACILLVAFMLCRAIAESERRRIRESEEILALLRAIKAGIACTGRPLGEIYRGFSSPALTDSGFLARLSESEDIGIAASVGNLPDGIQSRLVSLSASLGRNDREREGELCDYYIAEIAAELPELRRESLLRAKSRSVTAAAGSLMLVLLLI